MSIHEHLPPEARKELKQVGWTKGLELAKVARREGEEFDCATWMHKARSLPKEEFKQAVEKELTGKDSEPWEIMYFKVYKSQIPVLERAIDTAALMLGTDKSRGYCLEMICADFLAGAHLDNGDPNVLLQAISRLFNFLPGEQQQQFLETSTRGRHEPELQDLSQILAHSAGTGGLRAAAQKDSRARRLALPALRRHAESRGPSSAISQPLRRGCGGKSDYAVRHLPQRRSFPDSLEEVSPSGYGVGRTKVKIVGFRTKITHRSLPHRIGSFSLRGSGA